MYGGGAAGRWWADAHGVCVVALLRCCVVAIAFVLRPFFRMRLISVIPVLMTCVENLTDEWYRHISDQIHSIPSRSIFAVRVTAAPLTRWTVAELGPNQTILPADLKQKALVQQWMFFADQEVSRIQRVVSSVWPPLTVS